MIDISGYLVHIWGRDDYETVKQQLKNELQWNISFKTTLEGFISDDIYKQTCDLMNDARKAYMKPEDYKFLMELLKEPLETVALVYVGLL